ncbi:MAG: ATP-binding cassette domain-containing protein [Candidatus Methanoperedens sp.]|nr:ATP-binding cassette domain-containing protein [Candidatus Methanoperedens sp.]MCE8428707.1 ATP-binding cassette domain-containing protein [Candidatus Methanoperedens sp.]
MSKMNAIRTSGLHYIYADGTVALSDVDFEVKHGEKIAVLGPNGSGKSTLFYHFNGLIKPSRGEVQIFDERISKNNIDDIRKRVGLVFQNADSQLFCHTVLEDISFGPRNIGLDQGKIENRVEWALRRFNLEQFARKNPANLSAGQKKRVAIAGVVAMEPDVLVLDEPTTGLDAGGITDTMELLDELNNEGKTIIMSTHDSDLAAGWADRIYVLNKGKVFGSGIPGHIFANEKLITEAGLKHPVIVSTFREFKARGISKGELPLSVLDLMESLDTKIMNIRCAIASCDIQAGDDVSIRMKDGMLVAEKCPGNVIGKAVSDGKKGEDIAVKDVCGDLVALTGQITIIRVPGIIEGGSRAVHMEKVQGILEKNKGRKIGAMGTSAKVLTGKMGIRCDFEFDVAQSGILAALRGFDVIIFVSGRMADRVLEKVKGRNIKHTSFVL